MKIQTKQKTRYTVTLTNSEVQDLYDALDWFLAWEKDQKPPSSKPMSRLVRVMAELHADLGETTIP